MSDVWKSQRIIETAVMIDIIQHTSDYRLHYRPQAQTDHCCENYSITFKIFFLVCPLDETTV